MLVPEDELPRCFLGHTAHGRGGMEHRQETSQSLPVPEMESEIGTEVCQMGCTGCIRCALCNLSGESLQTGTDVFGNELLLLPVLGRPLHAFLLVLHRARQCHCLIAVGTATEQDFRTCNEPHSCLLGIEKGNVRPWITLAGLDEDAAGCQFLVFVLHGRPCQHEFAEYSVFQFSVEADEVGVIVRPGMAREMYRHAAGLPVGNRFKAVFTV